MRILIIEDDIQTANVLKDVLKEYGYAVEIVFTGGEGQLLAEAITFDLILLDLRLPDKNGFDICRSLRQNKIKAPILMITGHSKQEIDEIKSLDCGADDYLQKPFSLDMLLAHVRALLRREPQTITPRIQVGDLVLDTVARQVFLSEGLIKLSGKEYAILEYLMRHPDQVVTRTMLEQHIWESTLDSSSNLIDVNIKRLRDKLDHQREESLIQTIRGIGYRLSSAISRLP